MLSLLESSNDEIIIDELRERLVDEMTTNYELYDECDLERVKTNEWAVKRYLNANKGDVERAFDMAREALKWRKSFGVNEKIDLDAPLEFYKIGALFPYEVDREGRVVIYIRIRLYKSFPKLSDGLREFLAHIVNKVDLESGEKGYVMLWDMSGVGPSNWDLTMIRFLINLCVNYFPDGIKKLVVVGLPWIMNPFLKIALKLIPEYLQKGISFISKEDLFKIVNPENVPDFLGGTCQTDYRKVPDGAKSAYDLAEKNGYTFVEVDKMLKYYEKDLNL